MTRATKKSRTHEIIHQMATVISKLLLNVSNSYYCIFQIISMTIMTDEELRQRKSSTMKSESAQVASSADVKTSAASASSASAASSSSSSVATAMSSNVKLEHSDSNLTSSLLVNLLQNKDNFAAAAAAQAAMSLSAGAAGSAQAAALSQAVKSEAVMAAAAAHAAATAAASSGLNPAAGSMGGLGSGSTPPKKLRLNSSVSSSVGGSGLNPGASILCKSEQMASASFSDTNKLLHHSNLDSSTTNKINRSQSKSASNTLSMAAGATPRAMGAGSSSLMPPPLQPPVIAGANPALAGASGTISTLKIHEINTATGEKQFVKTSRKDTGNFRLNPITGELESGPSESSSEGEADTPTSGLETGSMNSISSNSASKNSSTGSSGSNMNSNSGRGPDSSKALKLKLKLPVTPPTSSSEVSGGHSRLSSMTSSSSDFSKNDPKVSKSDLNNGPKLPKLILSMRDKTVKVSANSLNKNKRALEEADMDAADDSDGQDSIGESQNITVPSLQGKLKIKSPKRTLDSDVKTEFNIKSEFNTKLVPSSSSSNSSSRHGTVNNHVNSATNQSKSSSKNSSNNSSGSTNNSSSSDSKDSSSKQGVQVNNSTASSSLNNSSSSDSSKKSSNNSSGILKKADLAGNSNAGSGSSTPSSSTKKLHNNDRLSAWAKTLSSRLEKGAFANSIEHDHDAEDFASNIKKGKFSNNFKGPS